MSITLPSGSEDLHGLRGRGLTIWGLRVWALVWRVQEPLGITSLSGGKGRLQCAAWRCQGAIATSSYTWWRTSSAKGVVALVGFLQSPEPLQDRTQGLEQLEQVWGHCSTVQYRTIKKELDEPHNRSPCEKQNWA